MSGNRKVQSSWDSTAAILARFSNTAPVEVLGEYSEHFASRSMLPGGRKCDGGAETPTQSQTTTASMLRIS